MFSIREAIRFGWTTFKGNWKFLLLLTIVVQGFSIVAGSILSAFTQQTTNDQNFILGVILGLIVWLFQSVLTLGRIHIYLTVVDGGKGAWGQLLSQWRKIVGFVIGSILFGIFIVLGALFFVIPGIIVAIRLSLWMMVLVDKGVGPWEAIKTSWRITKGSTIKLFLWGVVSALVMIVAALPLGLGLLVAMPVTLLGTTLIYRKLSA